MCVLLVCFYLEVTGNCVHVVQLQLMVCLH